MTPLRRLSKKQFVVVGVIVAILGLGSVVGALSGALPGSNTTKTSSDSSLAVVPEPSVVTTTTNVPLTPGAGPLGYFNSVACPSSSLCIAVGGGISDVGLIDRSTDGGKSFAPIPVPRGAQRLSAVACSNSLNCVAAGIATLLYTSDGGVDWSLAMPPVSQTLFLGASCGSALRCVAVGMRPRIAQPDGGVLLQTSDGGRSWTIASTPKSIPGIGSVSCPSATTCVAVGGTVLVSTDAGATWSNRAVPNGIAPLSSVSCSTPTACVAVGPDSGGQTNPQLGAVGIATSDGGASFHHVTMPPGSAFAVSVSCSANTCEALGADSTGGSSTVGFWSANAGNSWSVAGAYPTSAQLRGISCMTASSCIAVGKINAAAVAYLSTSLGTWTKAVTS